ncbi:conserved hypothetical protein [Ricinus communis]|uniref:Uncharacterized protein n=1 Tax=Ricinus communis TaxID=3988 RepID=B9S4W7_RICCO|nr:conserved hypothetical protein [Ricinus communis]
MVDLYFFVLSAYVQAIEATIVTYFVDANLSMLDVNPPSEVGIFRVATVGPSQVANVGSSRAVEVRVPRVTDVKTSRVMEVGLSLAIEPC